MTPSSLFIQVDGQTLDARIVSPSTRLPAVLLVHGWDSDQHHYEDRARQVAELGCVCMTIDLRGHGRLAAQHHQVTPADNLRDVLAAYDTLAARPEVDPASICLVGTSYGGYLAVLATSQRPVRWLALRVPALYQDQHQHVAKAKIDRAALQHFRETVAPDTPNRALQACAAYRGDVLLVASACDQTLPPANIAAYRGALSHSESLTYRRISEADHALSDTRSQQAYDAIFSAWITEMILGGRRGDDEVSGS